MSKHFHEEWSFRVVFTRRGNVVKERRYQQSNGKTFKTKDEAVKGMGEVMSYFDAYIQTRGCDGEFDAYEIYAPVRRIVTEWEDSEEETR